MCLVGSFINKYQHACALCWCLNNITPSNNIKSKQMLFLHRYDKIIFYMIILTLGDLVRTIIIAGFLFIISGKKSNKTCSESKKARLEIKCK
jgi:hypothetical protein